MQEARVIHTRLLFGEGSKPDTKDSTVDAPSSAKKAPDYLRLLPQTDIDPAHHLLAEPVSYPQLPEPSPEAYARYLQVQQYTSVEAQAKRTATKAIDTLKDDAKAVAIFALVVPIVSACVIEHWIGKNVFNRRQHPSFDHSGSQVRY